MTRLYSYVCALRVCVYSFTHCDNSRCTRDCYLLWFTRSSEHFAKAQFAAISLTFVKATGQSNKLLRLCVSLSPPPLSPSSSPLPPSVPSFISPLSVFSLNAWCWRGSIHKRQTRSLMHTVPRRHFVLPGVCSAVTSWAGSSKIQDSTEAGPGAS